MKGLSIDPCRDVYALLRLICVGFVISWNLGESTLTAERRHGSRVTPMHKVLLTQRGYIQFLRWELPVPEFKEFTFCLWLESSNLTHAHSIFSYSKNERDRLVRSWISPGGRSVHLEIGGVPIFGIPSDIRENRWYHVCQSWESRTGRYALWIDGRIKVRASSTETTGHAIPSGGDIVLGQEYTDFDKGLEEGVEGAVFGFNLLLASSFGRPVGSYDEAPRDPLFSPSSRIFGYATEPFFARIPMKIMGHDGIDRGTRMPYVSFPSFRRSRSIHFDDTARSLNRTSAGSRRRARNVSRGGSVDLQIDGQGVALYPNAEKDPLGLQLVKLSYVRCEIGRGSPFIGGPLMLISWSRTPVRIFGGATLKNVRSDCGNF